MLPPLQFLYPARNGELAAALGIHHDVLGNLLNRDNWIELLVLQMAQIKRLSRATQNDMCRRFGLVVTEEGKGNDWSRTTSVVLNAAAFPEVKRELADLGLNEGALGNCFDSRALLAALVSQCVMAQALPHDRPGGEPLTNGKMRATWRTTRTGIEGCWIQIQVRQRAGAKGNPKLGYVCGANLLGAAIYDIVPAHTIGDGLDAYFSLTAGVRSKPEIGKDARARVDGFLRRHHVTGNTIEPVAGEGVNAPPTSTPSSSMTTQSAEALCDAVSNGSLPSSSSSSSSAAAISVAAPASHSALDSNRSADPVYIGGFDDSEYWEDCILMTENEEGELVEEDEDPRTAQERNALLRKKYDDKTIVEGLIRELDVSPTASEAYRRVLSLLPRNLNLANYLPLHGPAAIVDATGCDTEDREYLTELVRKDEPGPIIQVPKTIVYGLPERLKSRVLGCLARPGEQLLGDAGALTGATCFDVFGDDEFLEYLESKRPKFPYFPNYVKPSAFLIALTTSYPVDEGLVFDREGKVMRGLELIFEVHWQEGVLEGRWGNMDIVTTGAKGGAVVCRQCIPMVGGAVVKKAIPALPIRDRVPLWMSATLHFRRIADVLKENFAHACMYDPETGELLRELSGSSALCHHVTDRPQLFNERARAEAVLKLGSIATPTAVISRLESVVVPFVMEKYGEQKHFLDWRVHSVAAFEAWLDRDGNREQLWALMKIEVAKVDPQTRSLVNFAIKLFQLGPSFPPPLLNADGTLKNYAVSMPPALVEDLSGYHDVIYSRPTPSSRGDFKFIGRSAYSALRLQTEAGVPMTKGQVKAYLIEKHDEIEAKVWTKKDLGKLELYKIKRGIRILRSWVVGLKVECKAGWRPTATISSHLLISPSSAGGGELATSSSLASR